LLKGISTDSFVYFCHSYYPEPKEENVCASMTDYGTNFPSAVFKNNVYGVQFHPEKSQKVGLKIMENFLKLC
jgi:glutamine amidotransferase